MMPTFAAEFSIGGAMVGLGHPVFIIAEIGVNHNGDMELAKRTISAAAVAGVDAVKFQSFKADGFLDSGTEQMYEYYHSGRMVREPLFAMMKRLELPEDQHRILFDFTASEGMIALTSVCDKHGVELSESSGAQALKIASADFTNLNLLKTICASRLPVLVSTGMSTQEEILEARGILKNKTGGNCAFLHCVSLYPTPLDSANLRRMSAIQSLTGAVTGYSDHTQGIEAACASVVMGACILEKHFTIDRSLPGPDHAFSADPEELKNLVEKVRVAERMLGDGGLDPVGNELSAHRSFRPSITARMDLFSGMVLTEEHICLKWPGTGLHPREMPNVIGKIVNRTIMKNVQIAWDMLK